MVGLINALLGEVASVSRSDLADPDLELWGYLRRKLGSTNELVLKAALDDLKDLCRATRAWELGGFWDSLSEVGGGHMGELADCVRFVVENALAAEDEEAVAKAKEMFSVNAMDFINVDKPEASWSRVLSTLETLLSEKEMLRFLMGKIEESFRHEKEETFYKVSTLLTRSFVKLFESNEAEIRDRLYRMMQDSDSVAGRRAYDFYSSLKQQAKLS